MLKKANEYKGRKIRVTVSENSEEIFGNIQEFNILQTLENFKNDPENIEFYNKVELIQDDLILYKADIKTSSGNLAKAYEIRKYWNAGKFDYREYLTKEEIKKYLDDGYFVAISGLQEIDLKDLHLLK